MQALERLLANVAESYEDDGQAVPATEQGLSVWRRRIDAIDRTLVALLNERSRCANEIGHIKKHLGLPVYVPSREEEVIAQTMRNNPGPLPDIAVRHIFERIIDETRSLERRKYQDPDE